MLDIKMAVIKALIVLVPSYSVAFLTEKMVYVVPMLVASGLFATGVASQTNRLASRRVDEDTSDGDELEDDVTTDLPSASG